MKRPNSLKKRPLSGWESLENRCLLAAIGGAFPRFVSDSNGDLTIQGTRYKDDVEVGQTTNPQGTKMLHVGVRYYVEEAGEWRIATTERELTNVRSVVFRGYDGDDKFAYIGIEPDSPTIVAFGGAGNDSLKGGPRVDSLNGEAGNDSLYGMEGGDTLRGGDGSDYLSGLGGNDRLEGGEGADDLSGFDGNDRIYGGAGGDRLWGGIGHDQIRGGDDDDIIYGGEGNDTIWGEGGDDTISGEYGRDELRGGAGHDKLYGGDSDDFLYGDEDNDLLSGGNGRDIMDGGIGVDRLIGGNGDDTLIGGVDSKRDRLQGGPGADRFKAEPWGLDNLDEPVDYKPFDDGDKIE